MRKDAFVFRTALLTVVCLLVSTSAYAKWWIFGSSDEAVELTSLYLSSIAFDETGESLVLFPENLVSGNARISGKAKSSKGRIASVEISIDGKKTWQEARLSDDGTFEFFFKPEKDKTYDIYVRATDTLARTNDVDATHKVVTLSDKPVGAMVVKVLSEMADAYSNKDGNLFMSHVAESFTGDPGLLDFALRKDFSSFSDIKITLTPSGIVGSGSHVQAVVNYSRTVIPARSGIPLSDRGMTRFVFELSSGEPKLYSMSNPMIFGISDAENLSDGDALVPQPGPILVLRPDGTADLLPPDQALAVLSGDEDSAPAAGSSGPDGIPAPEGLSVSGMLHHMVELEFRSSLEDVPGARDRYEVVVEESISENGPWDEVASVPFDTFVRVTTDRIAQEARLLYYRVRIRDVEKMELSPPSNVVVWDNR